MYRRIVVPLDGSTLAERALPQAEFVSRVTGGELVLMRVVDLSRLDHFGSPVLSLETKLLAQIEAQERKVAHAYLDALRDQLATRGIQATTEVRLGVVARELIGFAGPLDLVVMATQGRGSAAQSLLSSTTEIMARHSRSPVLLVQTGPTHARTDVVHSHHLTAC